MAASIRSTVRGFTILELLIVLMMIAILAAIAVPNFLEAQVRSKIARSRIDQASVAHALQCYYADNQQYLPIRADIIERLNTTPPPQGPAQYDYRPDAPSEELLTFYSNLDDPLLALSTPVAYLTNAFVGDAYAAPPNWQEPGFRSGFGYLNFTELDGPASLRRFALISPGPTYNVQDFTPLATFATDPHHWPEYDPTNGTVSFGKLSHWGDRDQPLHQNGAWSSRQ
jgi:prepilin-type N-terminal cleavage/methylation domain-containing protein